MSGNDIFSLRLQDLAATHGLARLLASCLRARDVVALAGPLGSGKTTLVRDIVRVLGQEDEEVPSPTFTLVQTYDLPNFTLWHFDLFRVESWTELVELDFEDAFGDGVSMIEWPDRMGALLPVDALRIDLDFGAAPEARTARMSGSQSWRERVDSMVAGQPG